MTTTYQDSTGDVFGNIHRIFTSLPNKLEKDVRDHLKNVYGTLALALGSIVSTEANSFNENKRLAYMFGLSFLVGIQTGPLIEYVGADDPSIVFNAYLITMIVFGCFTMMALHADSTKYLYLGGMLSSALLCLLITSLIAPYSPYVRSAVIWAGLAINCGFVVYDTQLIAEKCRRGNALCRFCQHLPLCYDLIEGQKRKGQASS
uniref:Bax inhibitor 1 n=1 Tax=Meloidogyne floridensis TaxID=298350 RepID=A0A915PE31_9BILA